MPTMRRTQLSILILILLGISLAAQAQTALRFVAATPCRVVDTRLPNGPFGGPPIQGQSSRDFAIPNGPCNNIPNTAAAYSLNVTVVPHGPLGYLTIWPTGQQQPQVSTLNSLDGRIKANAAIVPAGSGEAVSVFVTDTSDVVLDIDGYFVSATDPSALEFFQLTPCRVADTRNANGDLGGPYLTGGVPRDFPILKSKCIPQGVTPQAYSMNFTAVPHEPLGYLTVWPTAQNQPLVSTLNAPTGTVTANAAIVPAGSNGKISTFALNDTDLLIDIDGYFATPDPGSGSLPLYALSPCRVLDTRQTIGAFVGKLAVPVVESSCGALDAAQAFVLNATVVPTATLGYLTLWPDQQNQPLVSTLNAYDGAVTSNMAIMPTTNGWIDAYAADRTQLILDISSYFAPITPSITTTFLPAGILNAPYSAQLYATNGFPPYTWSVTVGTLPQGLTLSSDGLISGTPTAYGTSYFTVQVKDAQMQTATAKLSIIIQQAPPLYITTYYLANGTQGAPYSASLQATGGVLPYTWSLTAGSLPPGLSLSSGGVISGTPSTAGTVQFSVEVTDSESPPQMATATLSLTIDPNLPPVLSSISPQSAPAGGGGFTLQLYGSGFNAGSVVQWNGAARATTYNGYQLTATILASDVETLGNNSVTVYNAPPGGGLSAPLTFTVYLGLPTNDLVYSPVTQLLWASTPSTAGPSFGNSVVPIDPATGAIGTPIWVGSEPTKLAISSDGTTLWVGLNGAAAVRQVNLTTQQAGTQFSLGGGNGLYNPPNVAQALSVMPGSPNTVAVSAANSPYGYGGTTAIYDNGVERMNTSNMTFSGLAFSPSGTEIYAVGGNYNGGYYVMTVDGTGITSTTQKAGNVNSTDVRYDSGRVYLTNGEVLDSEQGTLLGTFYLNQTQPASGPVVPDSTIGRAFILESVYGPPSTIGAYDISTFVLRGNIGVSPPNDGSTATSPVRWGQNGLAFRTASAVYILTSPLVRDLSMTPADVGVGAMGPGSGSTGTVLAYTLTITNYGPNPASPVVLNDNIPQGTVFSSATTSQGYCSGTYVVLCNLGTLANNGVATVTINVTALNAGAVQNTAQVSAAQGDPNLSNNTAVTNTVISGSPYNPVPVLSGISPSFVQAGTGSFTLTVSGNQFTSTSQVLWNGNALPTTYSSSTQLMAQVDSSLITSIGWAFISVSNPAPGGGLSASQSVTAYDVVSLDTNHLLFDPFTRQLYVSVPGTAPQLQGNSIVAIDPNTGALGTPVNIGSEPGKVAESDDGQYLYVLLNGSLRLARYNLVTGTADATTYSLVPQGGQCPSPSPRDLAVTPGNNSTLAIDLGSFCGSGIFDISNGIGTFRGKFTGGYSGSSLAFPDASHLYTQDVDTSGQEFYRWNVDASGLTPIDGSTLNGFGTSGFKLKNGLAYAVAGGLADPAPTPPKQVAQYQIGQILSGYQSIQGVSVAPDPPLDRVFFLGTNFFGGNPILASFDQARYEFLAYNSFAQNPAGPDLVRWGKDGLAFQEGLGFMQPPGSGRLVLLRGAFVLPEWGTLNPTPGLTSVSPSSAQAGGGNFYLTATGSNFVPGAVLLWNGSERTTTYLDAAHLKVAIAAADIAKSGTATLTVVNPGSAPSGSILFTIQ
jgi:uncharacterized repeat protein (TIGR01451 family)